MVWALPKIFTNRRLPSFNRRQKKEAEQSASSMRLLRNLYCRILSDSDERQFSHQILVAETARTRLVNNKAHHLTLLNVVKRHHANEAVAVVITTFVHFIQDILNGGLAK